MGTSRDVKFLSNEGCIFLFWFEVPAISLEKPPWSSPYGSFLSSPMATSHTALF